MAYRIENGAEEKGVRLGVSDALGGKDAVEIPVQPGRRDALFLRVDKAVRDKIKAAHFMQAAAELERPGDKDGAVGKPGAEAGVGLQRIGLYAYLFKEYVEAAAGQLVAGQLPALEHAPALGVYALEVLGLFSRYGASAAFCQAVQ